MREKLDSKSGLPQVLTFELLELIVAYLEEQDNNG